MGDLDFKLDSLKPFIIKAYEQVYGSKHSATIKSRIKNAIILTYHNYE